MTEAQIREKVVNTAKGYLGYKESDGSHRKIIDVYNNHKPLAVGYKVKYIDSWCATYCSAIAILCGLTDIMPTECSCTRMIELYKKIGRWVEGDSYIPKIADLIMYDWDDNGVGENKGAPDHVGFVVDVSGSEMTIIEGNKNNAVEYRKLKINGKYIRGYCIPDYASKATVVEAVKPNVNSVLSFNKIDTVKEVQNWLNANYKSSIVADGVYGVKTKTALIKALQIELNLTYNSKLTIDGICGEKTKTTYKTLRHGDKNNIVSVIQALLICNKISNIYLDGDYGSLTVAAVKAYQKKTGLVIDGIAGKNTFAKLCD